MQGKEGKCMFHILFLDTDISLFYSCGWAIRALTLGGARIPTIWRSNHFWWNYYLNVMATKWTALSFLLPFPPSAALQWSFLVLQNCPWMII